jgi:tetratricopeptide (TPR) repeat protein
MAMDKTKQRDWQLAAVAAFLLALIWAVFGQTFHHHFVNYDDPLYVLENPHVRAGLSWDNVAWAFTHVHSENWHPLTTISHMLDCQLFGLNAGPHHLVNVLWHSAAAVLLFLFLAQITSSIWPSAFVAAVFAIHPLRVESVAWIAERKDVLSAFFFVLTLIAYFRWTQKQTFGRYIAMAVLFACGLMSKPMLVTLPIVLLLLDYWPLQRFEKETVAKRVIEKIPLFVFSIASCAATLWAQDFALGSTALLPLNWRIANAIVSYFAYIWQMLWPVDLSPFYIHPENRLELWRLIVAMIVLIGTTAVVFVRRKQNPYLIVGWLWYLVVLVPVIGIVQVGLQGHADRYTYLPQIGLYIALVWLARDLTGTWLVRSRSSASAARVRKIILSGASAIIVGLLSFLAWKQTTHWRDSETLWRYALEITPNNDVAHVGLGGFLFVYGQTDEAIEHYRRALQLRDGNVAAHYGLGKALAVKGKTDEAIFHFEKALSIQPNYVAASNVLGTLFASKGEIGDAIAAWRQTLSFDPDNVDAENNIAWMRATAADASFRDGKEALALARRAIETAGETPFTLRTLAVAQAELGQFVSAVATAEHGENLARRQGDAMLTESLKYCVDLFRRGQPLHTTQVSQ